MRPACGGGSALIGTRTWGNIAHLLDGNKENETVAWSTLAGVARPPVRGDSSRRRERGPTAEVVRPPRVVLSWWRLRGSLREVRFRWYHSVRWSVVLQRHGGGGSRMAAVFPVRCGLHLSVPYRRRVISGVLGNYMSVDSLVSAASSASAEFVAWSCCGDELCGCVDAPIRPA